MIELGQVYRSCDPRGGPNIRIESYTSYGAGRQTQDTAFIATITEDGRPARFRRVSPRQLHDSPTTRDGKPRRTGYALETT